MTTVLVTGVGAIIGYGILRSLRASGRDVRLVGCDIYPDAVGQQWCDHFVQAPPTASPGYATWLERVLVEQRVDLLFPGIEQDVHYFSEHRELFQRLRVAVVLNEARLVALTRDKWLMHEELAGLASPLRIPSLLGGSFAELAASLGLPFLLKPRQSYASKGIVRVNAEADFAPHAQVLGSRLMAQPIVGSDDEEYTVAAFGDGAGGAAAMIALQRRLAPDGSTAKAWVRQDPTLEHVVASLCAHFKPIGPTNIQLRRDGDGWKLLEINPRISSTTSMRSAFGYNEAAMCIDFYLENKAIRQPQLRQGFAARYIEDVVVYDRDHF